MGACLSSPAAAELDAAAEAFPAGPQQEAQKLPAALENRYSASKPKRSDDDGSVQQQPRDQAPPAVGVPSGLLNMGRHSNDGSYEPMARSLAIREESFSHLPPRTISFEVLAQIQQMQRQLALVNSVPALGLLDATEMLSRRLKTPLVSIVGFVPDDQPRKAGAPPTDRTAVLLSAFGRGALVLERNVVMSGPGWATSRLLAAAFDKDGDAVEGAAFYTSQEAGDDLPRDWWSLRQEAGLRSFATILIGPPEAPVGALMVARQERDRLTDRQWWQTWMGAAATGLLHIVSNWQVPFTTRMLQRLDAQQDRVDCISTLLQGAAVYMLRSANLRMGLRLALLDEADRSRALVFRSKPRAGAIEGTAAAAAAARRGGASMALPADPTEPDVVASEMAVAGTLLESAISMCKARFVRDCTVYLQTCAVPARDMFVTAEEPVASLVVVPLIVKDIPFGALYFTLDTPSDFTNLQDTLLGFVASVTLIVHNKLAGHTRLLWGAVSEATKVQSARLPQLITDSMGSRSGPIGAPPTPASRPPSSKRKGTRGGSYKDAGGVPNDAGTLLRLIVDESDGSSGGGGTPCDSQVSVDSAGGIAPRRRRPSLEEGENEGTDDEPRITPATNDSAGSSDATPAGTSNCILRTVSSRRLCTEQMMQVLQGEIQRNRRRQASGYVNDLVLDRVIGTGGFGAVYRGTWRKLTAAIKVFYARSNEKEALKDAVEMAVLSTVHHPNIVQVFACLTDMVEVADNDSVSFSSGGSGAIRPRYRKLLPGEEESAAAVCSIVVMEFCEHGTLRDAIKRGVFHRQMPGGMLGVDVRTVVEVLLEVAESIGYLHSLKLLHCDIKIENILLKSDITRPLGFVPKLADFGLVKVLPGEGYIRNRSGAGTVSYLAPECFEAGSKLTTGVDAYAFGILMYEIYTGRRPYEGLTKDAIITRVHGQRLRPTLPSATPADYRALALRCWSHDAAARPTFQEIASELSRMADTLEAAATATAQQQPRAAPEPAPLPAPNGSVPNSSAPRQGPRMQSGSANGGGSSRGVPRAPRPPRSSSGTARAAV